ncbi:MAG: glutaminase A [Gammaproteobacteria bacterium]
MSGMVPTHRKDNAIGLRISPIQHLLTQVYDKFKDMLDGKVADYIPELNLADPDWFGIAVVTVDGHVYTIGDAEQRFTIQSISKAFTYALALEERGLDYVLGKVGVEPSGDAFNAISLDADGRPANPMINAGAIATTGLIREEPGRTVVDKILAKFGEFAGAELGIDEAVYRSESDTGHRNRAIGFMLRNFNIIEDDPLPILENYFQQCSVLVNCHELALMGATLANRGVNPVTGKAVVDNRYIKQILSVMCTCGMYDYSGNWLYHVGLPAKSGVGGGILTILPGQMSIAVFSPPLDEKGNSCRGIAAVKELSSLLNLHVFNTGNLVASVIRARLNLSEIMSNRQRNREEFLFLLNNKKLGILYQLQGYFSFGGCEKVIGHILENDLVSTRYIMINLSRVLGVSFSELDLLQSLAENLRSKSIRIVFCDESGNPVIQEYFKGKNLAADRLFSKQNEMLEWVEDQIIETALGKALDDMEYHLAGFSVCNNLSQESLETLKSSLELVTFEKGERILTKGDHADAMYFLVMGHVDVHIEFNGTVQKVASISPGNLFGEMAVIDGKPRSASVVADSTRVVCYRMSLENFEALDRIDVKLKVSLLKNIAADLAIKVRKADSLFHAQKN